MTEIEKITAFLKSIGIAIIEKELPDDTFLPGLELGPDVIYTDTEKLKYPGDLLHEAGHIAVTPPDMRKQIGTTAMPEDWPTQGDEIAAILWSYAALKHLDIDPEFVFHENGYKGCSAWFTENFTNGSYMGLPLLQWYGMTTADGETPFPHMTLWMRP